MKDCTRYRLDCVVLGLLLTGCTSLEKADWERYDGPGKEHFLAEEFQFPAISDPLEPMNRAIGGFNHGVMVGIVDPLGGAYRWAVPKVVRTGLGNFFANLLFPVHLAGNLLQWKWGGAWDETKRFAANTTLGGLGFWDAATGLGLEASKEDFGQAFGAWGWRNSTYLMLPFLGPSTIRDGLGSLGDAVVDPLTYAFPASAVRSGMRLAEYAPRYFRFVETNYDPYQLGRLLFVLNRELQIGDYSYGSEAEQGPATETLEAVFLAPEQHDFDALAKTGSVMIQSTGKKLSYTAWIQDEPSSLLFFLPGTGGHRLGNSSLAIAEIAYRRGFSVVAISNAMNFDFIRAGSSVDVPGYIPSDAADVHVALDTIYRDLESQRPGHYTERRLAGISMGALHTLFIAAAEQDPKNELIDFEVYLALNSPVDYEHAVKKLDAFYNVPMGFAPLERKARVAGILNKVLYLTKGELRPGKALPFTEEEAQFLIGLSFRLTLADVIYQSDQRLDPHILKTQASSWNRSLTYQEIFEFSFIEYLYAFALPYYSEHLEGITRDELGARELFRRCGLPSVIDRVADNEKVFFVSNENDFLLRPDDVRLIRERFGTRAKFFERGGHIGNLHLDDVQQAIQGFLPPVRRAKP